MSNNLCGWVARYETWWIVKNWSVSIVNCAQFKYLKMVSKIPIKNQRMSLACKHPLGAPINVLKFTDDKQVKFENEEIEKMFLHPDVKNRKIVIFSIIGAFRKGKSFFLDYCLRYLYANVSNLSILLKNSSFFIKKSKNPQLFL